MKEVFWITACFVLFATSVGGNAAPMECSDKVSPQLKRLFTEKFPKLRMPSLADLDKEYIDFDLKDGGDGCFAAATGDFDGDQQQDLAILLIDKISNAPSLIVALKRRNTWATFQLQAFCTTVPACYVKPIEPGTYSRFEGLDGPVNEKDERQKITSNTTSVIVGKMESTGIVYVYSKGHWTYVWVSD